MSDMGFGACLFCAVVSRSLRVCPAVVCLGCDQVTSMSEADRVAMVSAMTARSMEVVELSDMKKAYVATSEQSSGYSMSLPTV